MQIVSLREIATSKHIRLSRNYDIDYIGTLLFVCWLAYRMIIAYRVIIAISSTSLWNPKIIIPKTLAWLETCLEYVPILVIIELWGGWSGFAIIINLTHIRSLAKIGSI